MLYFEEPVRDSAVLRTGRVLSLTLSGEASLSENQTL